MSSSDLTSRTHSLKPDDLIQDYISDVWGEIDSVNKQTLPELSDALEGVSARQLLPSKDPCTIKQHHCLVPTLKYQFASDASILRNRTDLLLLLLCNLYLLRRSLSPKVRQFILNCSEQLVDDMNAAFWLKQLSAKGVFSEI